MAIVAKGWAGVRATEGRLAELARTLGLPCLAQAVAIAKPSTTASAVVRVTCAARATDSSGEVARIHSSEAAAVAAAASEFITSDSLGAISYQNLA